MEVTNTPVEGTGSTTVETQLDIKGLLDSETTTTEIDDADSEALEVSNTDTSEVVEDEKQSVEDSETVEDEAADDSEAVETEPATEDTFKDEDLVTIDGEQITFGEFKKQRMLHADYTRKRQQETAELKQHMARYQVQQVEMADMRVAVTNDVAEMKRRIAAELTLESFSPPDPSLYEIDPYEYGLKKMEFERKQAAVHELAKAEQLVAEQNARWHDEQFKLKQATALEEFSTKHVEFADKQNAPVLLNELGQFLADNGFGREEIEGIADSRIMDIVYRLYKAETVAKQVPQVVKSLEARAKLAMPGTSAPKTKQKSDVEINMRKYKETGSSEYSNAVFRDLLEKQGD